MNSKGKKPAALASPVPIAIEFWNVWRSLALLAAVDLDVFTAIAQGKTTAAEIAGHCAANESAMRRLLDAVVAMGHLRRRGERYSLTPASAAFLVRGSDLYRESSAQFEHRLIENWLKLPEVVRSGRPVMPPDPDAFMKFLPVLVKAIFPTSFIPARAAVAAIPAAARKRIRNILDVAAGTGAWSIPFAQAIPQARVTVVDFPAVTAITREYTTRFGVGDRYDYIEGNLREVDFGRERFDLVILGHIVHSEGAEWGRRLIEKAGAALRARGMVLIPDFIANDERTGPVLPMLFGLNMLVATPHGDVFTMREYKAWLKGAGFKTIRTIKAPSPSPLILAMK